MYKYNPFTGKLDRTPEIPLLPVHGGTGTSTTFTQGSVVFAGASGVYAQDNTKFFWDNTNKYLGIGGIPTTQLDIINSTVGSNANFRVRGNNQGITAGQVFMDVFSGDSGHGFYGYGVASMLFGTNGTTKMTIDSTGNVGVGKIPSYLLDVNGTANANLLQTFLVSIGWTDTFDSNLSTPKNFFNFGSDWHGSAVLSSNVYLQNDALKIANSHATISGSVLKIPGNGKPNQGAFVFYTAPSAAVTAAAAYAGIQRMVIQTDGNITMGTAVSKNRLQLDGATASFGICFDVNNSSAMGHNLYYSGGWKRLYAGTDTSLVNYADGSTPNADISFYQVVTGAAAANSAISFGVPTLYLKSSNKYIGVGTTAPASLLANTSTNQTDYVGYGVQLTSGITWTSSGAGYALAFTQAASGTARNGLLVNTASTAIDSVAMAVCSTAVDKGFFVVRSDGHVGLGMTTDNYTDITSTFTLTQLVHTSGTARTIAATPGANTGLTASTEVPQFEFLTSTQSWATGALTENSYFKIAAPTYAFAGASTLTTASTFTITGAAIAGTNATITNPLALWVKGGVSAFAGDVGVGTTKPIYPFHVVAPITKTTTSDSNNFFFSTNEAAASNPFGLYIFLRGSATQANRKVSLNTTNYGLVNDGVLALQEYGGTIGIRMNGSIPSAYLHIAAGTATAGTAPIKLTAGTVNTTPEAGTIEFDGSNWFLNI
jgi:hypothetical protein